MKAIVTGGAGFIGSHLVDRLIQDGYSVTIIDNMSCGHMENLASHLGDSRLVIHKVDIKDAETLNKIFAGHDLVFHLAAQANIRKSLLDHRSDLDNNIVGTLNVLDAMNTNGIKDLIFASTSAVYGEATLKPTTEEYFPYQTSLYGASKLACEAFAEAYTEFAPLKFWAFRFANVIGERCRRGVIWDFTHKLRENNSELEILGDGLQSKEYLHVSDCVQGIMLGYTKAKKKVNIFNLGLDEQTLVKKVADLVISEAGLNNNAVKRKYSGGSKGWIGDNPQVVLSIEKIKALGWRQRISSEEAIKQTASWTIKSLSKDKPLTANIPVRY
ncbi:MAG: NAD(P)-bd dom protein [Euryarchaeota archaeon]|nr:NAD(P)-bd dom protein [Euryarchaeota archaeon]